MPSPRMKTPCVNSPCIKLCRMDAAGRLCVGCFRSLAEIARWSQADDAERLAILAAAAHRRDASQPDRSSA